jgi:hypothetical protein
MEFGDWEVREIGAKFVDGGFDFGELGRGWGSGIVGHEVGIRSRLNIYRVPGLSVAGEGYISADRILTVISRWIGRGSLGAICVAGS